MSSCIIKTTRCIFQVYQITNDLDKYMEYINIIEDWRISRDTRQAEQVRYPSDLFDVFQPAFGFQRVEVSEDGGNLPLSELIKSVTVTNNPVSN